MNIMMMQQGSAGDTSVRSLDCCKRWHLPQALYLEAETDTYSAVQAVECSCAGMVIAEFLNSVSVTIGLPTNPYCMMGVHDGFGLQVGYSVSIDLARSVVCFGHLMCKPWITRSLSRHFNNSLALT